MDKLVQELKSMTVRQKELEQKYMHDAKLKVQLQSKTDKIKVSNLDIYVVFIDYNFCNAWKAK